MVAAGQAAGFVHALLHDGPLAVGADDESVQVDLEAVGDGVVVDARGEPAGADQLVAVEPARWATASSSAGVLREWRPRPPQKYSRVRRPAD